MATIKALLLLGVIAFFGSANAASKGYYRAAAVEYSPIRPTATISPEQAVKDNLANFKPIIETAQKQQVDIIVFPEYGLSISRDTAIIVPDPAMKVTPTNATEYSESLTSLSEWARTNKLYVVVNVIEDATTANNQSVLYNTNVVFDRNGTVIDRYRKYNLFGESLNNTDEKTTGYFTTDFNVNFGQMICFDILFKKPVMENMKANNLTNFIMTSEWFSELPFLTSVQTQWMWAVGNNVNLVASGLNVIAQGSGGSGIFRGNQGPIKYTMSDMSGTTIVIGDVSIEEGKNSGLDDVVLPVTTLTKTEMPLLLQPDLSDGKFENIPMPTNTSENASKTLNAKFAKEICHGHLCCSFDVSLTYDNKNATGVFYKAFVFDGKRTFGSLPEKRGIQICGIVSCSTDNVTSCDLITMDTLTSAPAANVVFGDIKIAGDFIKDDSSILPDILLWPGANNDFLIEPKLVNFTLTDSNGNAQLSVSPNKQIVTVAIHSRVFSRDNGASGLQLSTLVASFTILLPLLNQYLRH